MRNDPRRSFRASEGRTQFDSPDDVFKLIRRDKNDATPISGSELFHFSVTSQSTYLSFSSSWCGKMHQSILFVHVWLTSPPPPHVPGLFQLTRLQYPASGCVCTYQSLSYTKKYEAQALLSKNNRSDNLVVQYAVAVLSHHWTSLNIRVTSQTNTITFSATTAAFSHRFILTYNVLCYKYNPFCVVTGFIWTWTSKRLWCCWRIERML